MNTSQLRYSIVTAVVGFLAASYAAPLDKSGATVIKDASLAKAYAQATRQFTPQGSGSEGSGFTAKNPGQPYATTISKTGQLKLKVGQSQVGISAAAYGFGSQRLPISAPTLSSGKDKDGWPEVQLGRTGLSERYVNGTGGMHHWLSVASRPATAQGNLWVNLSVTGAKGFRSLSQTAAEVTLGATKLKYAGLKVWDAAGRTLPARMETNSTGIGLVVTDANAKYPVTIDPVWTSETKLVSDNPYGGEGFGITVAIDGNVAAIGTRDYGVVYVFEKSSSGWTLQTTLYGSNSYQFGKAIAVHGDMIAVGAPQTPVNFDDRPYADGAVYLYQKQGNGQWIDYAQILDGNMWAWSAFGSSIALSDDYLVIGAPDFDQHVSIYTAASNFTAVAMKFDWDGASVAVSGKYVAVLGNQLDPRVSVFEVTGGTWNPGFSLVRTFTDPLGGIFNGFGKGLVLTDTDLFSSVPSSNYVAIFNNWKTNDWTYSLVNNWDNPNPGFGQSLAYNGQTLFVGDPTEQFSDSNAAGAVHAYVKNSSGDWIQTDVIRPSDNDEFGDYGWSIAATASDLLVGWPYAGYPGLGRTGAAYVYALGSSAPKPTVTVTFPSLLSYGGTPGIYGSLLGKGLVTLSSPAPAGGTTLGLNSTSGHLTVPATVTVAAGETTAEFPFATEYVGSDTDVLVQASGAAVTSGTGTVKVLANKVAKIYGATINSLGTGTGKVVLAVPTLSDFTVYLSTANPNLVQVPASVIVPAGSVSATFTITSASATVSEMNVMIFATPANGEKAAKVNIRPEVQVRGIEFVRSTILAGTQTEGEVRLEGPAPAGGQVVALSSSRMNVRVPASVTVPEGQYIGFFNVTSIGGANEVATITAKNTNGVKKTATLTVVRPSLRSIDLSASYVTGGKEHPTFTVTLASETPVDVTISLSSNNSILAKVPATITIPAGQRSATGTVTTGRWSGARGKAVKITARYASDSAKTVTLTVTK